MEKKTFQRAMETVIPGVAILGTLLFVLIFMIIKDLQVEDTVIGRTHGDQKISVERVESVENTQDQMGIYAYQNHIEKIKGVSEYGAFTIFVNSDGGVFYETQSLLNKDVLSKFRHKFWYSDGNSNFNKAIKTKGDYTLLCLGGTGEFTALTAIHNSLNKIEEFMKIDYLMS